MKVARTFNNNAVAVITDDNKDAVLLGSGVGFGKRVNDSIGMEKVEKIYYIQDDMQTKFLQLLENTAKDYLVIAEKILEKAKTAGFNVQTHGIISLTDHIAFAITRAKENIFLPNLILNEVKALYKEEYAIGLWAIDLIKNETSIQLPEDEAGYIALHIINSSHNQTPDNTVYTVKFIQGTMDIIEEVYQLKLDKDDLNYFRITTHLKFLAQRIFSDQLIQTNETEELYQYLLKTNSKHDEFIVKIREFSETIFNHQLNQQEILYILIHITKFSTK